MHGVTLQSAPADWEILQQENGAAKVKLTGTFQVHPAAIKVGVLRARPMVRLMQETDNMTVIPWTAADNIQYENPELFQGSFETEMTLPAGGLYRLETCLETKSTLPNLTWLYRGDCVLHLGVGNLFVIAGQSNSAGYSRDFCYDPPEPGVHLYRNRGKWDMACHPMNESTFAGSLPNEEMGIPGVSPYLSFARSYKELSGLPVGLIQTSLGGSPMKRWLPPHGSLYLNMLEKLHQTGGKYAGILWYQGCSDTTKADAGVYYTRFDAYVAAVRQELGYEIPVFTMQLNRQVNGIDDDCWGVVREAQREAAEKIPGVYILSTTNCSLSDGIHNSAQANVALGEKLARQCAYVLNGAEEFETPALTDVQFAQEGHEEAEETKPEECWLDLTFSHVRNCFLLSSSLGSDSGFTVEDDRGEIEIRIIRAEREDRNHIYLKLARRPEGRTLLSFMWQANPVRQPIVDEVTWLAPLSFYQREILT